MSKYQTFTTNDIEPQGWLLKQLKIQAKGLSGNLDLIWPDVRDSAWIGGTAEGWERVPYWLDGFIPLAYLLKDDNLTARAKKYIDAILENQKESGWICPCSDEEKSGYDMWALFLICKVLVVYYECSGDGRIEDAVYRALKNCYELLQRDEIKIFNWAKFRWYECFISLNWLYGRKPEKWIIELGKELKSRGIKFGDLFEMWKTPLNRWTFETHIVNIVMALKHEALTAELLGDEYTDFAEKMTEVLSRYNGTAVGLFTGDECLAGVSPIQGTELCAAVEQMYSYEILLAHTGDAKWGDRLESIAYNALPAAISEDLWTHQYDQMANQIACRKFGGKPIFRTNNDEAHLFGLEPNFGCCTANFNQGWPKLALSAFMRSENGIVSAVPVPSKLKTKINCSEVEIELITDYPFKNSLKYIIKTQKDIEFEFGFRIPSWSKKTYVNGKEVTGNGFYTVKKTFSGIEEINVTFTAEPRLTDRPNNMKALKYGPFVMSLPIAADWQMNEYTKDGVERKFPYCDYELIPKTDWNYAFDSDVFEVTENDVGDVPFSVSNPPVKVKALMKKIEWGYEDGYDSVCRKTPRSTAPVGDRTEIYLQPYGCTKLRMTEMPVLKGRS